MSWPPYPEYLSTGIDAVGDAPVGWTPIKLRHVLSLNPSTPLELRRSRDEASFLPMELIGEDGSLDLSRTRPVQEVLTGYSYFADGDVLFAKVTPCFENGKAAIVRELPTGHGFGTTEVTALRPGPRLDQQFLGYLVRSDRFRQSGIAAMTGAGGLKRVPDEHVREYPIAMPPLAAQRIIVDFLDQETSKVDALIDKQEQLIATLREDRNATINQAATRGLDPSVEPKDSGVDWIGDMPAHWNLRPLWSMYRRYKRQNHPDEQLLSIYRDHGVVVKESRSDNFNKASADLAYYQLVEPGDLVVNRMKAWQGSVAISGHRGIISPDYYVYKPLHSENNDYLNYLFRCGRYAAGYGMWSTGVRPSQWSITPGDHLHLKALIPPRDEQDAIVHLLDEKSAKINNLIDRCERSIETLQEYRSALITDAVTGKIDVRGAA